MTMAIFRFNSTNIFNKTTDKNMTGDVLRYDVKAGNIYRLEFAMKKVVDILPSMAVRLYLYSSDRHVMNAS